MPQENNMAELLRLMKTMIGKVDDLSTDMKDVKADVQVLKTNVRNLNAKVDHLTGRFEDVARVVIEDTQTLESLGKRVVTLEGKAN
jgi:outer membrane murein-binding lipoprotein Lpp